MNKNKLLWIILDFVFIVLFNAFFFLIGGGSLNASVWLSYAFIHLAYLMVVLTPQLTKGRNKATTGLPLFTISSIYFLVEFVVGIFFILLALENITSTLLVQLFIAGAYAVVLILNLIANEHTASAETSRQVEIGFIKTATNNARVLMNEANDTKLRRVIGKICDELASSQTKSHPDLSLLEADIISGFSVVERSLDDSTEAISQAERIVALIRERNRRLKVMN
jgi:hypothetical protein